MKLRVLSAALAAALTASAAGMAHAAQVILPFTVDACSANCGATTLHPLGTVTVDDTGGLLTFTVLFRDASNNTLARFNVNDNDNAHESFAFDVDKTGLTIDNFQSDGAADSHWQLASGTGPYKEAGFTQGSTANWPYAIDYNPGTGPGAVKQGFSPDNLTFTVSDAANDLTVNDLAFAFTTPDHKNIYAVADVWSVANGATGNIGAVPEPASWAMMLLGFFGAGAAMRRRRKGAQAVA
jgi:hypothetical protein